MKILHCCLAAFYIDNYGYQENILPKMHQIQGHDVSIVASTETYVNNTDIGYAKPSSYFTKEQIPITRIPYIKCIPQVLSRKLRIYSGLKKIIEDVQPEIIFIHGVQFLGILTIVNFVKRNKNVIVYADGHTDFINSAKNWISRNILHKVIYRFCAKKIDPYTKYFYGVLPLRSQFFEKVYKISPRKIKLLPLGADDSLFDITQKNVIKKEFRYKHQIKLDDKVIVSGGKIDKRKNIILLIKAIKSISNPNIKLVLFGSITKDIKNEIENLINDSRIKFLGWQPTEKIYDILLSADLGCFPGTHSVLWEQSIGTGLPCIFKKWEGIEHVDIGGNCILLEEVNIQSLKETIEMVFTNIGYYNEMKTISENIGSKYFSYSEIAKRAIDF